MNPFPLTFPPLNATINHPNPNIDFTPFLPQAGMTAPPPSNTYPYTENYFLSIERQLAANTVLSLSYVGSQAHHLLVAYSANPGNPALCLALSNPSAVAPGSPTCGPFGENSTYVTAAGQVINGTRGPLGPNFDNDDYIASIGNSNYNSFQASLRHTSGRLDIDDCLHVQQIHRSILQPGRTALSIQLRSDARDFGVGFDAQSRRNVSVPASR